jgi:hypothetical protein
MNLNPQRLANETMEQYRARRKANDAYIAQRLAGRVIWDSHTHGTYDRKKAIAEIKAA